MEAIRKDSEFLGIHRFYFNDTWAASTPQVCVKPEDHVLQHDLMQFLW